VEGMPALSPTAIDGAVVEWLVAEGDMVEEGSGIAEIQTDKSVVTWTSTDEAYIAKLLVAADADNKLSVGTPLAVFVDEKADVAAFRDYVVGGAAPSTETAQSAPQQAAKTTSGRIPSITFRYGLRETAPSKKESNARIFASPYAKKLANEMGIALDAIDGASGYKGRIIASDVMKKASAQPTTKQQKAQSIPTPKPVTICGDRSYEDVPVSVMREIIGQRLCESKFSAPHFYVTMECEMDKLLAMRAEINADENMKISVNDFVIKACAMALRANSDCNVGWIEGEKAVVRKYNYVDISVAVATPSGLITPIIEDADRKSLSQISAQMKDLARRAKENKLLPQEFQGGTFTISNLGMFGVSNFTAIINPPQSCILAVGGAKKKLVAADDDLNANGKGFRNATTMQMTLSSDHRSVDGAVAALMLNSIRKYMEKPAKMML